MDLLVEQLAGRPAYRFRSESTGPVVRQQLGMDDVLSALITAVAEEEGSAHPSACTFDTLRSRQACWFDSPWGRS
jgi:hypothetical protein